MSRWQEQFNNHPFQQTWKKLKVLAEETEVDDEGIVTNVEELARFKKAIAYVDALIDATDPELVPQSTWQNFQSQCQACLQETTNYKSNRNIHHLENANANIDNLLTYVRPYVVDSSKVAKAAQAGFLEYSSLVADGLKVFKGKANDYLDEFEKYKSSTQSQFAELEKLHLRITELKKQYFDGTESEGALESRIDSMFASISDQYAKISEYHTELFDSGSESIKQLIAEAKNESEQNKDSIESILHDAEKQVNSLKVFYKDVYGTEDDNGKLSGGLKQELVNRKAELDSFKEQQQTRYKALNDQIEELLPGATSAGLATAYRAMRKSFSKPIKQYSYLFYSSVAVLTITTLLSSIDSFWTANEVIKFVDITNLSALLNNLIHKLPIIVPVLWLAIFASKRRSEAQRLQQEYAHKEAIAKSYQNFKTQIDNLNATDKKEELMEKLLSAAIDAVAANASDTLDKKHGDKTPAHEGLDKTVASLDKLKGIFK